MACVQAWCTGWWKAEREDALRQLEDLTDAPNGWQPAFTLLSLPQGDPSLDILEDDSRQAARLGAEAVDLHVLLGSCKSASCCSLYEG
jgi:hypothetical protein